PLEVLSFIISTNLYFWHPDIVLVCGSDRSIQVFDMNKGTVASEAPDAHSRAIHCITQNKGSAFSSQAPDSYNLFLTSAVTDGMKIWDLRTLRCVRRYENHVNRCQPCSSAVSPCGRFIATGSEDNCAYVYDIRSSNYLHRLQNHSDTVLNVAFNPATPQQGSLCNHAIYSAISTILYKILEVLFISLHYAMKIRNRCSIFLKHVNSCKPKVQIL
uniref:Uncharacterized protein n=1 Tax=Pundamilia nyererei TaxID=303518 RepID=A0A3B4GU68_9CICH